MELCRSCGIKKLSFCDLNHEAIRKLRTFVPGLINCEDKLLPESICISCYQMVKTLVFNLESIADMQKILKIQYRSSSSTPEPAIQGVKRSYAEDVAQKYKNLKVSKIGASTLAESLMKSPVTELSMKSQKKEISTKSPIEPPAKSFDRTAVLSSRTSKGVEQRIVKVIQAEEPKRDLKIMCIRCSAKINRSDMEAHQKTCTRGVGKNFDCFCGKTLESSLELNKHVQTSHPSKKVSTSQALHVQNKLQTVSKPQNQTVSCLDCQKKLKNQDDLKTHRSSCKRKSNES